ncbi:unnamed protein product [Cuscuta epithymum]|uniref:Uncharacterized protein n=2 Tax=Cuscuta epithymum TaxID=186058 RepID=A0AAV0G2D8_9ASTE|nr:unnamed protein product [Cuscuta epithymum]
MGDLETLGGASVEESKAPSPPSTSNSVPSFIEPLRWVRAEEAARNIIQKVQPTSVSAERRRAVIDYVQKLIKGALGLEVFSYGSVPLKTYLPDGDIDLTVFGSLMVEDALVHDMTSVLEGVAQNSTAEFAVKDVQLIRAEVKLVKCIVQNIVIDISINQIGGLCTLCFLEKVDQRIGKDHLFKRSIILIKAWCYYESRILGAHHGLISTYALETLILYIFHLFHATLEGPLAVLYKFLDYFSKFDWENYCISLSGPVRISSLPELVVEVPENDGGELLLDNDFLKYCANMFSVSSRAYDMNSRTFQQKHLNIVDPLKDNNNLGRSVSKGNYYRIQSAFTYGARKLGRILVMSDDDEIIDELHNFFSNTLGRQRPDLQDHSPVSEIDESQFGETNLRMESGSLTDTNNDSTFDPSYGLSDKEAIGEKQDELVHRFCGDAMELATSKTQDLKLSNGCSKTAFSSSDGNLFTVGMAFDSHIYRNHSMCNAEMINGNCESGLEQICNEEKGLEQNLANGKIEFFAPSATEAAHLGSINGHLPSVSGSSGLQPLKALLDLSGDYEYQLRCLEYGRWCYECTSAMPAILVPPPPPPLSPPPPPLMNQFQIKSWNPQQLSKLRMNGFPNGGIPSQPFYAINPFLPPNIAFGEMHKARGTGTYFPNMNRHFQGHRPPPSPSVRSQSVALRPTHQANGWNSTFMELERDWHELPQPQSQLGAADCYEIHQHAFSPQGNEYYPNSTANGTEAVIEFGTVGHVTPLSPSSERSRQHNKHHCSLPPQHSPNPHFSKESDRAPPVKSAYHLKDEDDFPPLSA